MESILGRKNNTGTGTEQLEAGGTFQRLLQLIEEK